MPGGAPRRAPPRAALVGEHRATEHAGASNRARTRNSNRLPCHRSADHVAVNDRRHSRRHLDHLDDGHPLGARSRGIHPLLRHHVLAHHAGPGHEVVALARWANGLIPCASQVETGVYSPAISCWRGAERRRGAAGARRVVRRNGWSVPLRIDLPWKDDAPGAREDGQLRAHRRLACPGPGRMIIVRAAFLATNPQCGDTVRVLALLSHPDVTAPILAHHGS